MSTRTVAAELVDALRALGVKHVFGVPSGGWVDYLEALRVAEGIEFVLATHEGGAAMMAEVTGRLTGVPGVCFGTFGPGATNLATGVGGAFLDRSPMIALTDEMAAPMRGRTTQMGIDHQALFRPITKRTTRLVADAVRETVFDAAALAVEARPGPVHIGLPVGLSSVPVTASAANAPRPPARKPIPKPSSALLDDAAQLLARARKPILAVGLGAVHANVKPEIKALAERFSIPVVLTPMAKGMLAEDHPSYAGVLFHALSDVVGQTHQQADLVIAIGYDPVEFNLESWLPRHAPLINIDVVPVDLERERHPVAAEIVGDILESLSYLLNLPPARKDWDFAALAQRRAELFARLAPPSASAAPFGPKAALSVLRERLPTHGIMTCDVGAHTHLIGQQWRTPEPKLQVMTNGWSSMGYGIPAAIAAKLARPDRAVCAVLGDGGFLMSVGELATAARLNLPLVFVLLTDNDLALIRIKQEKKHNPIYGTAVRASGALQSNTLFGVPVYTALTPDELRSQLTQAFARNGPTVVEAVIDSREYDDVVLRNDRPS